MEEIRLKKFLVKDSDKALDVSEEIYGTLLFQSRQCDSYRRFANWRKPSKITRGIMQDLSDIQKEKTEREERAKIA